MSDGPHLGAYPALATLVARARRRLRAARMLAAAGPALVAAGAAGLAWTVLARVVLLPPIGSVVAAVLVAVSLAVVTAAGARHVPAVRAAWAADVWLATRDRFATAVELVEGGRDRAGLAARQVAGAEQAAADVATLPGPPAPHRLLGLGAALVLAAGTLAALPNPQDVERERRAADGEAVEDAAADLRDAAERVREGDAAERADLADRLEALADEVEDASLEEALSALDDARAELAELAGDDLASTRTALAGLEQELARTGVDGDGPAERLEALADDVATGQVDDPDALAERLAALADALAAGPDGLADALADAGAALAAGAADGASQALRDAAASADQAASRVDAQQASAEAAGAAADAAARLRDRQVAAADGEGEGAGEGAGEGDGDGEGAGDGGGDGAGAGSGTGEGSGGGGGGSGSGTVGPGAGDGADEGEGGVGGAGGGQERDHVDGGVSDDTVYDPPQRRGASGEELRLPGRRSEDGDEIEAGEGRGEGLASDALVPYRDVLADYATQAERTIEADGYPPRLRAIVQTYFDRLGGVR